MSRSFVFAGIPQFVQWPLPLARWGRQARAVALAGARAEARAGAGAGVGAVARMGAGAGAGALARAAVAALCLLGASGALAQTINVPPGARVVSHGVQGFSSSTDIVTERGSTYSSFGFLGAGAGWAGASDTAHVNGYVSSYGRAELVLPVGSGSSLRPLAIRGAPTNVQQPVNAAYFATSPNASTGAAPGAPFSTSSLAAGVSAVSTAEYWHLRDHANGQTAALTLTWNSASGLASLLSNNLSRLSIVGWRASASRWEVIPSRIDANRLSLTSSTPSFDAGASSLAEGSISSTAAVDLTAFTAITLARINAHVNWDGTDTASDNTVDGGGGTWSRANTNWTTDGGLSNSVWPGDANVANFGGTGGTVGVVNTQSIGGLNFTASGYTLNSSSQGALQGAASASDGSPTNALTVGANLTATLELPLTGNSQSFEKLGTGTLRLGAANTYTGRTEVTAGTLEFFGSGTTPATGAFTVGSNGTTLLSRNDVWGEHTSAGQSATVIAGGVLSSNNTFNTFTGLAINAGTLRAMGGRDSSYGSFALKSTVISTGSALTVSTGSGINANTAVHIGSNTANGSTTFNVSSGTLTVAPALVNSRDSSAAVASGLIKTGAGRLELSGANAYTGRTQVNGGTLALTGGGTLNTVGSGGVFNYAPSITLAQGATLEINSTSGQTLSGVISGAGALVKSGSGTLTLTANNTHTGPTTVNAGTLSLNAELENTLAATTTVTVASGARLHLNGRTQSLSANLRSSGVLDLGNGGTLRLTAGDHEIASVEGVGVIRVDAGATLRFSAAMDNRNLLLVLNGGAVSFTGGSTALAYRLGSISLSANSSLNFDGNATDAAKLRAVLRTGSLSLSSDVNSVTTRHTLTVNNWRAGVDRFFTEAVLGTPARNVANTAPLNQIVLAPNVARQTYWRGSTGTDNDELLAAAEGFILWDTVSANGAVDGGTGTWNASNANWTNSDGLVNSPLPGSTSIATFRGRSGTVTVEDTQSVGGLSFETTGYSLTGGTLTGGAPNNVLTAGTGITATVASVLAGSNALDKQGPGTIILQGENTFTGGLSVTAGRLTLRNPTTDKIFTYSGGEIRIAKDATLEIAAGLRYDFGNKTITFGDAGGGTLDHSGGNFVTLPGGNTLRSAGGDRNLITARSNINLNGQTWTLDVALGKDATADLEARGVFSNNGNLLKTGAGTLLVTGNNTYTGTTTVSAGSVRVGNAGSTGALGTGNITNNAALVFNRSDDALTLAQVISGTGSITQAGSGTLRLTGANTYTGATSVTAGVLQIGAGGANATAGSLGSSSGVSVAQGAVLRFARSNELALSQVISGEGGLNVANTGTLVLTGNSTYTGPTQVSAGRLRLNATTGSALSATTALTVDSGATLELNGRAQTFSTPVTVNGTVDLGTGGTLTLGGTNAVHRINALTGTGRVVVNTGATLSLGADVANTNLTIELNGGTLQLGGFTHSVGTLLLGATSTLSFNGASGAQLTVASLNLGTHQLNVADWSPTQAPAPDRFFVRAFSVEPQPARDRGNIAPLNQIKLSDNATTRTYWRGSTGTDNDLILAAPLGLEFWDVTQDNDRIDGGTGTWNGSTPNWTADGTFNAPWTGGVARFGPAAGTVTVSGTQPIDGLDFSVSNYVLSGGELALQKAGKLTVATGAVADIRTTLSGTAPLEVTGGGTVRLFTSPTLTGNLVVSAGRLRLMEASTTTANAELQVQAGAFLDGVGKVGNQLTVAGTLEPGAGSSSPGATTGIGTLEARHFNLQSSGTLRVDLNANTFPGGTSNDLLTVTGDLTLGGRLEVVPGPEFNRSRGYQVINFNGRRTGAFSSDNLRDIGYKGFVEYADRLGQVQLVPGARVRIAQNLQGEAGSFIYSLNGFTSSQLTLSNTVGGGAVTSERLKPTDPVGNLSITRRSVSGFPLGASVSCIDENASVSGNTTADLATPSQDGLSLSSAVVRDGADILCTFAAVQGARITGVVFNDGGAPAGGSNTGTPHDGLRNGQEAGFSGVAVSLSDCSATTYASTTTDSGGGFSLALPSGLASSQPLCASVTLPSGQQAVAASANGTTLGNGATTPVGSASFTYTRSAQRIGFAAGAAAGGLSLQFGQVPLGRLEPDSRQSAPPGGNAVHAHRYRAGSAGTLELLPQREQAQPANAPGWSFVVYRDTGCTGDRAQASIVTAPIAVLQDQALCLLVLHNTPAGGADGTTLTLPLRARLTLANTNGQVDQSQTVQQTTSVNAAGMLLEKTARSITQGDAGFSASLRAKPGDTVEYRISFSNTSPSPVSNVRVSDPISAFSTWRSTGIAQLPAGMGCVVNTPNNPLPSSGSACSAEATASTGTLPGGSLVWTLSGDFPAGASGSVTYRVRVTD